MKWSASSLIATGRPSTTSSAQYTVPMPPAAIRRISLYRSGSAVPAAGSRAGVRVAIAEVSYPLLQIPNPFEVGSMSILARHAEGLPLLCQGPVVREQPQPLDGRDEAPLRAEPPAGSDRRWRDASPRLRLHPVPEGRQSRQSALSAVLN